MTPMNIPLMFLCNMVFAYADALVLDTWHESRNHDHGTTECVSVNTIPFVTSLLDETEYDADSRCGYAVDVVESRLIDIICSSEGFFSQEYRCPSGVRTIGYGFTDKKYLNMGSITKEDALNILKNEVIPKYRAIVSKYVKVPLTNYQEAALISFAYNCGEGSLQLLVGQRNRLNSGNYTSISTYMVRYVYGRKNGKPVQLAGLVSRRHKEVQLFEGDI